MKKIILSGVILLSLAVFFILRLHPGATASSQSSTFFLGQQTYISDSQAEAMAADPFIENGGSFASVQNPVLSGGVSEDNVAPSPSSVAVEPIQSDVSFAIGDNAQHMKELSTKAGASSVTQGSGNHLTNKHMAAKSSVAEAGRVGAAAPQAAPLVQPGNPSTQLQAPSQEALPVVGSYENLKTLLETASLSGGYGGGPIFLPGLPMPMVMMMASSPDGKMLASAQSAGTASANTQDYSQTNVQVEGVDEADIVKTDGTYIYQVNRERVVITKAYPPENMEVVSTLNYADKGFSPQEIYVDEDHLVVIGNASRNWNYPVYKGGGARMMPMVMSFYGYYPRDMMKAVIYDIRDKSKIKQVRELELNGSYVSSRKVGQSLYLIANKSLCYWRGIEINEPKPSYRDSLRGDAFTEIDYPNIKYFPDFIESGYLIVAGLNLDLPDEAANVSAYLGSGQNIYASTQNIYMAVTSYPSRQPFMFSISATSEADIFRTKIFKFEMSEGAVTYLASGKVPGTVLNQFSMDEYGDCFRIATTQGDAWRTGEGALKNNVYIFDGGLKMVGKVEGIAPGEKIYSVRFMGDRGYMVTYRTVDPFFVLDLKDPCNPAILGELKIPGYSNYLHPYDENHVIGFGKDTVELWGTAFYMGMKMAIFDVSDVNKPVEMFREKIGGRGTDSELLSNHKALLFSKEMNLLAFPVRIMEVKDNGNDSDANVLAYGNFSFQGAYVYNIDLVSGFVLKGKITHLSKEDYSNVANYWYDGEKYIERILYIDDTLYTLSQKTIKANDIDDLQEIDSLEMDF